MSVSFVCLVTSSKTFANLTRLTLPNKSFLLNDTSKLKLTCLVDWPWCLSEHLSRLVVGWKLIVPHSLLASCCIHPKQLAQYSHYSHWWEKSAVLKNRLFADWQLVDDCLMLDSLALSSFLKKLLQTCIQLFDLEIIRHGITLVRFQGQRRRSNVVLVANAFDWYLHR